MARGRKTALTLPLTVEDRRTLLTWQRATTIEAGRRRRAQIILLLTEGRSITAIAATAGISRPVVYKWVQRFRDQGLAGLWGRRARAPDRRRRRTGRRLA